MLFGADYYPEHWEKSDWKKYARIMKDGNFSAVRIAEFAWSVWKLRKTHLIFMA